MKHLRWTKCYLLVSSHPDFLEASTIMMDVDNKTMFHAVQKGKAQNELLHNLLRKPSGYGVM